MFVVAYRSPSTGPGNRKTTTLTSTTIFRPEEKHGQDATFDLHFNYSTLQKNGGLVVLATLNKGIQVPITVSL